MDIIEKLVAGHRGLSEKRDILSKLVKALDTDAFFWDRAEEISVFFKKEVREHFAIEEKVLFPVLKKTLTGKELEYLKEIETEHAPILIKLNGFQIVAENHRRYASKATRENMIKSAFEIIEAITDHAAKEDKHLLPLVKEKFHAEETREMENLYFKFIKI